MPEILKLQIDPFDRGYGFLRDEADNLASVRIDAAIGDVLPDIVDRILS